VVANVSEGEVEGSDVKSDFEPSSNSEGVRVANFVVDGILREAVD
jgi:hypothetical protein